MFPGIDNISGAGGTTVSGTGPQDAKNLTDLSVNFGGASIGGLKTQSTGEAPTWQTFAIVGLALAVGLIAIKN